MWTSFEKGLLNVNLLRLLWENVSDKHQYFLLRLMWKYSLIVPCDSKREKGPWFLVPSMLQDDLNLPRPSYKHRLLIRFKNFVPRSFFELFLSMLPVQIESEDQVTWVTKNLSRSHAFARIEEKDGDLVFEVRGEPPLSDTGGGRKQSCVPENCVEIRVEEKEDV